MPLGVAGPASLSLSLSPPSLLHSAHSPGINVRCSTYYIMIELYLVH